MLRKYELVEIKFIDMHHFQMYEGKFKDVVQAESGHSEKYIYANVSNFEAETYEESEVRIYAHSYEDLYCAEDYELTALYNDELLKYFKSEILKYKCDCGNCENICYKITELSKKYGSIYLLTAAIMRNNNLSYEKASEIAERLNSSDYLFDRLIDDILEE